MYRKEQEIGPLWHSRTSQVWKASRQTRKYDINSARPITNQSCCRLSSLGPSDSQIHACFCLQKENCALIIYNHWNLTKQQIKPDSDDGSFGSSDSLIRTWMLGCVVQTTMG